MSLRVGASVSYAVPPGGGTPGLRVAILINGKEVLIDFIQWFDLIKQGTIKKEFRLGREFGKQALKKAATKQEESTASDLGGHRQTGSGARAGHKGDGRVFGRFRIENKFTTAKSFGLKLAELTKIRAECAALEVPIFDVQFKDKGTLRTLDHWALVPWAEWKKRANVQTDDD